MLVKLYAAATVEAESEEEAAEIAKLNVVEWEIQRSARRGLARMKTPRMVSPVALAGIALFPPIHVAEWTMKYAGVAVTALV